MKSIFKIMIAFFFIMSVSIAYSQINIGKIAGDKVKQRTEQKTGEAVDKGLDAVEDGIKGEKKEEGDKKVEDAPKGEAVEDEIASKASGQQEQTFQAYSKYDFIPGQKVIFYEDFSQDAVGDFPMLWNTNGSGEIVTTNLYPGNWLQLKGNYCIWTDELLELPENYTIEFDVIPIAGESGDMEGYGFRLYQAINEKSWDGGSVPGEAGFAMHIEYFGRQSYRTYINLDGGEDLSLSGYSEKENIFQKENKKYHISIWMQKTRVRLYQDETKLFDLPKAFNHPGVKMDRIRLEYGAALITNIRIAVGAPDTRNKLLTEGKLVTYGIYFDVNKDIVKPESYGTLKDIANVLTENPDVRVKIIGFTDSDGDDAKNLDLSKRRAASVKASLSKDFAIDESRMETDGLGEGQPVAPNDTPANKALNRRVEFVKL